ncbi:peptidyl-prolyl cis-trans isomerase-like 3 [Rhizophagus clarus]|uniref:Peptidyl-prolyl cis-trans isomerase n=1 Tax=Rhizophagus clarus TaxID=94130 RepID=A0A8H3QH35_9GLOM|nr:peptidyl-prolyl cis-trans isomerase-like 3 [Rhizophagus clarus]
MSVTLHTDLGDLKIEVFCEAVPKTAENFLALCASGYYDNNLFHRNIKGFIVQTGDPTGTGKGGTSIWGKKFEDEIKSSLKHNSRDTKNTVFGKVIDGSDTTLDAIEKVPVDEKYRPIQEIRIKSVTIHANPLAERNY